MDRYELTRRIAILGIITNVFLLVLKLIVGFINRSQAMIADGFNSAGDVFASAMTLAGNKIASQPKDENHPYGHGKAEYIFAMIISFSLLLVAYKTFRSSLNAILNREAFNFSWWLIVVAVITIVLKIGLFLYTRKAGRKEENLLIIANSEDHRNDVFITSGTLLGILMGTMGIFWVDGIVGIGISIWIAFTAVKIFTGAFYVLMDTNISKTVKEDVIKTIESIKGVDHVDDVKAKPIGVGYIIIIKVSVLGSMTVLEGHNIAAQIKERIKKCKNIEDVVVHVNPA
ncbi:MAG: cation diffusion facilitator family transporter [Clostridia bacterium]|nr:cation diffusion facilitator family transporter [Clostridia bacterium]